MELFKIGTRDLIKGFILSILTVVVGGVITSLQSGSFPNWEMIQGLGLTGLTAGLSYLLKNFLTNSEDQFLSKEK